MPVVIGIEVSSDVEISREPTTVSPSLSENTYLESDEGVPVPTAK